MAGLLVSHNAVVDRAVKELIEQLMQFQLTVQFHDGVGKSLAAEELKQMIAREHQGPDELMHADSLPGAPCRNVLKPPRNIHLGLLQQPLSEVAIKLSSRQPQVLRGNL